GQRGSRPGEAGEGGGDVTTLERIEAGYDVTAEAARELLSRAEKAETDLAAARQEAGEWRHNANRAAAEAEQLSSEVERYRMEEDGEKFGPYGNLSRVALEAEVERSRAAIAAARAEVGRIKKYATHMSSCACVLTIRDVSASRPCTCGF